MYGDLYMNACELENARDRVKALTDELGAARTKLADLTKKSETELDACMKRQNPGCCPEPEGEDEG